MIAVGFIFVTTQSGEPLLRRTNIDNCLLKQQAEPVQWSYIDTHSQQFSA